MVVTSISITLSACGSGGNSGNGDNPPPNPVNTEWTTIWQYVQTNGTNMGSYYQIKYYFNYAGNNEERIIKIYSNKQVSFSAEMWGAGKSYLWTDAISFNYDTINTSSATFGFASTMNMGATEYMVSGTGTLSKVGNNRNIVCPLSTNTFPSGTLNSIGIDIDDYVWRHCFLELQDYLQTRELKLFV